MAQFYTSNVKGGIFLGYGDAEQGLGLNYYWDATGETYLPDRNAISPNADGYLDALTTLEFSLLRQPRTMKFYVQYEDGSTMSLYEAEYSIRRETHPVGMVTTGNGLSYSALYQDYDAPELEEGETATFVVEAWLDHDEFKLEDNKLAKIEIPFTKDTTPPMVTAIDGGVEVRDTNYVACYAVYADGQKTQKVFENGVFAMERGVAETYRTDMDEYFVAVADYARNEGFYYVCDGVVYEMDAEGFDHGRTIIGQTHAKMGGVDGYEPTFAWYRFSENMDQLPVRLTEVTTQSDDMETAGYSDVIGVGRTADGKVYASSMSYLYTFDPVTFEKTIISKYEYEGEYFSYMFAFAVAPGTNDLYGIVSHSGSYATKTYFCSINRETGEITRIRSISLSKYRSSGTMKVSAMSSATA